MSLSTGQRVDTIVSGAAPPYGDVTADSQIQDNAFDSGLWESAGVPDNGHWTPGAQRQPGNVEPEPPGRVANPDRSENGGAFHDGTPVWLS